MTESSTIITPPSSDAGDFESLQERAESVLQEIDELLERVSNSLQKCKY